MTCTCQKTESPEYLEGAREALHEKPVTVCPYTPTTQEWEDWVRGWRSYHLFVAKLVTTVEVDRMSYASYRHLNGIDVTDPANQ